MEELEKLYNLASEGKSRRFKRAIKDLYFAQRSKFVRMKQQVAIEDLAAAR
jgi:plasmid replication initiation protein